MKVFVCEDDKDILELIEILIKEAGAEVKSYTKLDTALEQIINYKPDAIVVDYWINGKKADGLIDAIKNEKSLKNSHVILVSAIDNLESVAQRLHVSDYIKKPFDIFDFQNKVTHFK